jgi:membrane protein implicated in regulation of membrane protease activity
MEFLEVIGFILFVALICTNGGALLFFSAIIAMVFWEIAGNQIAHMLGLSFGVFYIASVILINYMLYKAIDKKIKNKNTPNFA